jgi:hypothetical protein
MARLELSRAQILCFRRNAGSLDERLPAAAKSLRLAAWAGLQDSSPRAALLSSHARVEDTGPEKPDPSRFVTAHASLARGYLPRDGSDRPCFSRSPVVGDVPDRVAKILSE